MAGRGIARLRDAGVTVDVGVAEAAAASLLAPYLHHRRTGRPFVVLKLAASLDGRTAAPDGTSQWITGPEARADAHAPASGERRRHRGGRHRAGRRPDASPSATRRHPRGDPLRVVLGRAPAGAKVHPCLEHDGDLGELLDELGAKGHLQVLVEGGATVAHAFHEAGLVDRYVLYLAPGALRRRRRAAGCSPARAPPTIGAVWRGAIRSVTRLGADLRIDLDPEETR